MKKAPQIILLFVMAILLLPGCGGGEEAGLAGMDPAPRVTYFSGPVPRNIAHRGGRGLFPENTLYAFEHALAMDVQILETDAWRTRDGHVILLHDADVDRTTNGHGPVKEMTLDEVRGLDAAYRFSTDGGESFPLRGQGITIPTLEEAFHRFPHARFCIEIKQASPPMEQEVLSLIEAYGMSEKVCVSSFHDPVMTAVREQNPELCTGSGIGEILLFMLTPQDRIHELPVQARLFQIPEEELGIPILTPGFVEKALDRNMEVHVWTVNDPADMQRLLDLGAHGIITDYPDRLNEVMASSGTR